MDLKLAARLLQKLGNDKRLCIYQRLVHADPQGVCVGDLQAEFGIPASTLSHHLSELASVNLISQEKTSRFIYCKADKALFSCLIDFLQDTCQDEQASKP